MNSQVEKSRSRRGVIGGAVLAGAMALMACNSGSGPATRPADEESAMKTNQDWDKTFPRSAKVDHRKITFKNRYGITIAGDLYVPKDRGGCLLYTSPGPRDLSTSRMPSSA